MVQNHLCNCRKPKPGMLIEAQYKYNISMKDSWMIGDSESDIKAANAAGISNTVLVRSGHLVDESNSNSRFIIDSIKQSKEVNRNLNIIIILIPFNILCYPLIDRC